MRSFTKYKEDRQDKAGSKHKLVLIPNPARGSKLWVAIRVEKEKPGTWLLRTMATQKAKTRKRSS